MEGLGQTPLEQELMQRAGVIASIYGVLILVGIGILIQTSISWRRRPPPLRLMALRLRDRPWQMPDALALVAVLVVGFLLALVSRELWLTWTEGLNLTQDARLILLQSMIFHVLGLIVLRLWMARRGLTWRTAFGMSSSKLREDAIIGIGILLGALPILLAATILFHVLLQLLGYQPSLQDVAFAMADERNPWMRAYFVVLAIGLAPLFEELLFRGVLFPALARRYGWWASALVTSFSFAVIHGHLPSFVTLFALSLVLSFAYIYTGSIMSPIAIHAVFNGLTTAILLTIP